MNEEVNKEPNRRRILSSLVTVDGTIIEMVLDASTRKSGFVVSKNGEISEPAQTTVVRGETVVPFSADNNLLVHRVVLLPSSVVRSTYGELVVAIRAFIHRYADFSESFEEVAAYYVLLSWIYDAFQEVPYLRLRGDFGSGKSRCLLTIGSLCYKPMFASGASTVSPLFRIIDTFRGTLIIDEGDFRFSDERAEITKILNNGNAAGFPVLRSEQAPNKEFNPKAFVVFGPKIIATRRLFEDRALESRCITEIMSGLPPRSDIPLSLPEQFHAEATELRNKLLMYRFKNFHLPRSLTIDRANIEPRIAQVYAPLLAVIEDHVVRDRVIDLAVAASARMRAERSATVEAQLVGVLHGLWKDGEVLVMKTIAERFSEEYGLDYPRPITARWIGSQLRNRLSLTPVKTNGNFIIAPTDGVRLVALFDRYKVRGDSEASSVAEPRAGDDPASKPP